MKLSEFDYHLPEECIAQTPAEPRDASRLMVLERATGERSHHIFRDLPQFLNKGDVLVLNQTRVIPARIPAIKTETGGKAEILLLEQKEPHIWEVMVGGRRITEGVELTLESGDKKLTGTVTQVLDGPQRIIEFSEPIHPYLDKLGEMPLPPYITTRLDDPERYQTIYARREGSAAAPTAGLHFTSDMLFALQEAGIKIAYCTLHIGLDTFAPVKVEDIEDHHIHRERAILKAEDAKIINDAKLNGGRIIAVGTTSARTLETAGIRSAAFGTPANNPDDIMDTMAHLPDNFCPWRPVIAIDEETNLFITPGYQFSAVDALITNFHLPKSTLLMMISALVGRETILEAYQEAIDKEYRFFSFGDAMFIT